MTDKGTAVMTRKITTPDDPGNSALMTWIRDHLGYEHEYCLIWPFGRNRNGYGCIGREGKYIYVHRYICELVNGPSPADDYQVLHSCGRGHDGCVNPRHLSWGTPTENQLDRDSVGRPRTKLTPEQAAEIRDLKGLEHVVETARRFGVTEANVRQIQSGKTWRTDRRGVRGFTDDEVRAIRKDWRPLTEVAATYGCGINAVSRIRNRKFYLHVSDLPDERQDAA